jgi:hypothetical protein
MLRSYLKFVLNDHICTEIHIIIGEKTLRGKHEGGGIHWEAQLVLVRGHLRGQVKVGAMFVGMQGREELSQFTQAPRIS